MQSGQPGLNTNCDNRRRTWVYKWIREEFYMGLFLIPKDFNLNNILQPRDIEEPFLLKVKGNKSDNNTESTLGPENR